MRLQQAKSLCRSFHQMPQRVPECYSQGTPICLTPKKSEFLSTKSQHWLWSLLSWLRHWKARGAHLKHVLPGPGGSSAPRMQRMLLPRVTRLDNKRPSSDSRVHHTTS